MATSKAQRVSIFIIMIVMVVGTIGSFFVIVLMNDNNRRDQDRLQSATQKYQDSMKEYETKVNAQHDELSAKYYPVLESHLAQVGAFERDSVQQLETTDLVQGDGAEIDGTTKFSAYYVGWNPDGKIFDQSIKDGKLGAPLPVATGLDQASLIAGWKEGMKGMKIGGVRLIAIPSDKAYGEQGQGDDIPPNTPLKFIVMAIETPAEIAQPELPQELIDSYTRGGF